MCFQSFKIDYIAHADTYSPFTSSIICLYVLFFSNTLRMPSLTCSRPKDNTTQTSHTVFCFVLFSNTFRHAHHTVITLNAVGRIKIMLFSFSLTIYTYPIQTGIHQVIVQIYSRYVCPGIYCQAYNHARLIYNYLGAQLV